MKFVPAKMPQIINKRIVITPIRKNGDVKNDFVRNLGAKEENSHISHVQQRGRRHPTQIMSNERLFHSTYNNNWTIGM